jgi:hypothetical protein
MQSPNASRTPKLDVVSKGMEASVDTTPRRFFGELSDVVVVTAC